MSVLQVLGYLCALPAFFSVVSFIAAETPQEAAAKGAKMPADWSAGVMNHGLYYEWYTISDAPFLFAISLAVLVIFQIHVLWLAYDSKAKFR